MIKNKNINEYYRLMNNYNDNKISTKEGAKINIDWLIKSNMYI